MCADERLEHRPTEADSVSGVTLRREVLYSCAPYGILGYRVGERPGQVDVADALTSRLSDAVETE
jgi:hypothetical protein